MRLLKKIHYLIPLVLLALQAIFLAPTLYDILMEPPEGDEVLLVMLLFFLMLASLLSLALWKSPRWVNESRPIRSVLMVFLVLLAMLTTTFTYASWFLLVITFFIFYVWIRKTLNRTIHTYRNVLLFSAYLLLVQIFVISQLTP